MTALEFLTRLHATRLCYYRMLPPRWKRLRRSAKASGRLRRETDDWRPAVLQQQV